MLETKYSPKTAASSSRQPSLREMQSPRPSCAPYPQRQRWQPIPRYFTTSSANEQNPSSPEVSDFLPSDTMTNRFKNFYRMLTGNMSPAGQEQYWVDADTRYSGIDCRRCETNRDYLLQYSPIIRFMSENVKRLGGNLDKNNIRCRSCTTLKQEGGFDHQYGIMLCANYLMNRSQTEDVMAHEMVHAYDHLRFKTDLAADEDLRKVACSEIRASNLSGECRWANEFFRNKQLAFTNHHQDCVRRRAVLSVKMRPNCKDDLQAVQTVNEVWDSCFTDTRPFDEIYR